MTRIMLWADRFWPAIGGAEVVNEAIVLGLHERGHVIEVITNRIPPFVAEESFRGIPVHRLISIMTVAGLDPAVLSQERRRARQLVAAFKPDVMIINSTGSILFHLLAARSTYPARLVCWMQGHSDEMMAPHLASGQFVRQTDYLVGCSQELLDTLRRLVPEMAERSMMIHNTLPMPEVEPSPLPWNPPLFMYVGRISEEKAIDRLIEAFARVAAQVPDARLAIVGDGAERAEFEQLAQTLGIGDRVEFRGWIAPNDVPAALNGATALVLPSLTEGLPLCAVQASQMARPMVLTRVGGNPEICIDGETGLLCEPNDIEDLAAQMTRLIGDRPMAEAMGAAGRRHVMTNFAWETLLDSAEALLQQLTAPERS